MDLETDRFAEPGCDTMPHQQVGTTSRQSQDGLAGRQSRPSGGHDVAMQTAANINDILAGHVVLDLDCIDHLLLNAYVPNPQTSGQVATFMPDHLGKPIPLRR